MRSALAELPLCRAASFTHSRISAINRLAYYSPPRLQALRGSSRIALRNLPGPADQRCRGLSRSASSTEFTFCRNKREVVPAQSARALAHFKTWPSFEARLGACLLGCGGAPPLFQRSGAEHRPESNRQLDQFCVQIDLRAGERDGYWAILFGQLRLLAEFCFVDSGNVSLGSQID